MRRRQIFAERARLEREEMDKFSKQNIPVDEGYWCEHCGREFANAHGLMVHQARMHKQ